MKVLVFDMDGTITDLYGVTNWLDALENESPRPYCTAKPMYNMHVLNGILNQLKKNGWRIVVTTWLAKGASKTYDTLVRQAKLAWLEEHHFPFDELHMVKYGTTKANCTRRHKGFQILIDDNEGVRKGWTLGEAYDANNDIIPFLYELLERGC